MLNAHSSRVFNKPSFERVLPVAAQPDVEATEAERPTPSQTEQESLIFGKDEVVNSKKLGNLGIDPVRFIVFNALGLVIAFGGNLFGITSALFSTSPSTFQAAKLDQIYPISGYRRYLDNKDQYEFRYPQNWFPDQVLVLAKARESEIPLELRQKRVQKLRPEVAYGPAGSNRGENLSVMKSQVMPGFSLQGTLGAPKEGAEFLLANTIAPANSGKSYELLSAYQDERNGNPTYTFEYTVKGANFYVHSLSVIISRGTELYTFTIVIPQSQWTPEKESMAKTVASSFQFTAPTASSYVY
eukprot:CAMPEP_0182423290 /NCGR_PEP_ID=MMETSP1167-20130531/9244_1 /TAXON_ID=2988 /ORGANISM="Mallomonas Sp, Strain CCMP3275" /LENGTH=298 /DNA_ID=CAMNT_0024602121 /DNA_START=159 /DNA_END=1055 /DNA_ORIENTATION=+